MSESVIRIIIFIFGLYWLFIVMVTNANGFLSTLLFKFIPFLGALSLILISILWYFGVLIK